MAIAAEEAGVLSAAELSRRFEEQVKPVLEFNCYDCHSDGFGEAGIEFDAMNPDLVAGSDAEKWHLALDAINRAEMPPADYGELAAEDRRAVTGWIDAALDAARAARTDRPPTVARLTKVQYATTLQELLGVPIRFGGGLPDDARSKSGFTNAAATQEFSPLLIEMYTDIAREALGKAIVTGEKPEALRFRVTVGDGLGVGRDAMKPSGYKTEAIEPDHVRVEPLGPDGGVVGWNAGPDHPAFLEFERRIGVDMRGSRVQKPKHADESYRVVPQRYAVAADGIVLQSAFARKEVSPASWWAPSPNAKVLLQKVMPPEGPFAVRVTARAGEGDGPDRVPALRAFVGSRTDDGLEYATLGPSRQLASAGRHEFEFFDYFENVPSPNAGSLIDSEPLSGILIVGVWNDDFVTDPYAVGSELVVESIEVEAPHYPVWPPASHTQIFFEDPLRESDRDEYTRRVLTRFMGRAFRRPVGEDEVARYHRFWSDIAPTFETYEEGVLETLVAVLCSPHFLHIDQPPTETAEEHRLASKLAYFLWDGPPDAWLLEQAERGVLYESLDETIRVMLRDGRSRRFVETFASEWLRMDRQEAMSIDVDTFPDYTRYVAADMREETVEYLRHAFVNDLPARTLIDSDFAMLNQTLAEFYGIEGVRGPEFRPVAVEPLVGRGGLLTQGAFLVGHSDGSQPHPIKRAVWLKERILGERPPAPPPNVPEIDPDTPGFQNLTLKEQLELHRDKGSCRDCHAKIDPYGVVFEGLDAVGRFREVAKGRPVDAATVLPDGTEVDGVADLKAYILNSRYESFLESFAEHLYAYATKRDVTYFDDPAIEEICHAAAADDRLASIVAAVIRTDAFLGLPHAGPAIARTNP
ncbi:MAG: DUF1592 domain-containing protein [Planctomycetota bacterium]